MTEDPVALYLAGRISPPVALARLLLAGATEKQIADRVHEAGAPGSALAALVAARRHALPELTALIAGIDHRAADAPPEQAVADIAAQFDRAVAAGPEASVAFYSLGDPAILEAATAELVAWLDRERLIGGNRDVLDLGCGIGRVAAALAPRCRSVLGLDVSVAMVAHARGRYGESGARFAVTSGMHLEQPDSSFDLVLAVDVFPYLVQAGGDVAEQHVADAARVLRPGGTLAILNLSYRADPQADAADARRWAARHGLHPARIEARPFTLWDARAYVLRKPGSHSR